MKKTSRSQKGEFSKILNNKTICLILKSNFWTNKCINYNVFQVTYWACKLKSIKLLTSEIVEDSIFLCLLLRLIQIKPKLESIKIYLKNPNPYMRILGKTKSN